MISIPVQPNTPGAPSGKATAQAGNAMPFGFTFALQSVRAGHASIHLAETLESKDAALDQYNDSRRSRVEWGAYRV